jgi:hypothetical protein
MFWDAYVTYLIYTIFLNLVFSLFRLPYLCNNGLIFDIYSLLTASLSLAWLHHFILLKNRCPSYFLLPYTSKKKSPPILLVYTIVFLHNSGKSVIFTKQVYDCFFTKSTWNLFTKQNVMHLIEWSDVLRCLCDLFNIYHFSEFGI